ncbi:MAG TPA: hypothetical protein VMG10_12680 [Gemmataceae bacterium]|nr:hypothetical protein [Gemmataceae bacterium]
MLECRLCGAHISSLDAEASRRIAGAIGGVICPTCAIAVRAQHHGDALALTRELWEQSSPEKRCPHIRYNGRQVPLRRRGRTRGGDGMRYRVVAAVVPRRGALPEVPVLSEGVMQATEGE